MVSLPTKKHLLSLLSVQYYDRKQSWRTCRCI